MEPMKQIQKRIWLAVMLVANVVLWVIPSNVVEQIARDRHTLLGRYSRTHFGWILALAVFTFVNVYVDWGKWGSYKLRRFQLLAVFLVGFPAIVLIDFMARDPENAHYIRNHAAYRHPPDKTYRLTVVDKPKAFRTFPRVRPGYPQSECTLRTDKRGFRNQSDLEAYDVVVLGDSFAEGTYVTDEEVWPRRLETRTALSVYNLAVSGYDPHEYVASLERFGLDLKPRYVICMLYEGNDFRSAKSDQKRQNLSLSKRFKKYFKQSPIITSLDRLMINTLGPINRDGAVDGIDMLDWLPVAIPTGPAKNFYTFAPKQLRDLYQDQDEFSLDRHWFNVRDHMQRLKALCDQEGIRFVLVYAPQKAHVMFPLVADRLSAEKVCRFTALSYKKRLPEPDVFLAELLRNIEGRESVVREWCDAEGIPFVSLTEPLREAALSGVQVYFTYDQHWTSDGHRVAAATIGDVLLGSLLAGTPIGAAQ